MSGAKTQTKFARTIILTAALLLAALVLYPHIRLKYLLVAGHTTVLSALQTHRTEICVSHRSYNDPVSDSLTSD